MNKNPMNLIKVISLSFVTTAIACGGGYADPSAQSDATDDAFLTAANNAPVASGEQISISSFGAAGPALIHRSADENGEWTAPDFSVRLYELDSTIKLRSITISIDNQVVDTESVVANMTKSSLDGADLVDIDFSGADIVNGENVDRRDVVITFETTDGDSGSHRTMLFPMAAPNMDVFADMVDLVSTVDTELNQSPLPIIKNGTFYKYDSGSKTFEKDQLSGIFLDHYAGITAAGDAVVSFKANGKADASWTLDLDLDVVQSAVGAFSAQQGGNPPPMTVTQTFSTTVTGAAGGQLGVPGSHAAADGSVSHTVTTTVEGQLGQDVAGAALEQHVEALAALGEFGVDLIGLTGEAILNANNGIGSDILGIPSPVVGAIWSQLNPFN